MSPRSLRYLIMIGLYWACSGANSNLSGCPGKSLSERITRSGSIGVTSLRMNGPPGILAMACWPVLLSKKLVSTFAALGVAPA